MTLDPVRQVLTGADGVRVPLGKLLMLLDTNYREYRRVITGLYAGGISGEAAPRGGGPIEAHPKSALARYATRHHITSHDS